MTIIRVNYYTRSIEKVYPDKCFIETDEYDIDKVIQCCKGMIPSYGGKYSDNGIWRFVKDIPYLKGNFDFPDKDVFGLKIAVPGNESYYINNMFQHCEFNNCLKSEEINIENDFDDKKSENVMKNIMKNSFFRGYYNYLPNAIAQIKNGRVVMVYPNINFIPSSVYDIDQIKHILHKDKEYKGYRWVRYSEIFNYLLNMV